MRLSPRVLGAAFLALSCVQLAAELAAWPEAIFLVKPLLLPLLGAWYLASVPTPRTRVDRRMGVAFATSWVGDVALMLAPAHPDDTAILGIPKHDAWFLVGVGAFFVCHLAFIAVFRAVDRPEVPGPFPSRWAWFLPLAAYGLGIISYVVPRVAADPVRGDAAGPVAVYAVVLCLMAAFALQRHGRVSTRSFTAVAVGAHVFVASDSLIALAHLVHLPIPFSGFLIMSTYLVAEALIAWGVLAQRRDQADGA
ncbi:MAG: lysoplasmalogenase [Alphaproteobacteria bacterium]|nr:lysoplasmalogenase [Alphaproteobacteria bacterium]